MVFIDGTVVNVALPALQRELDASLVDVQWVVEAYALLLAALLLVGGAAGDRFGRRRVFLIGVALFAVSSVWCGLANGVRELILARVLQGIGGALLVPGSLAIISASFAEQDRGHAIGTWSGATAVTTALGPVLGGWLIDHVSWRAAFFINLPLAIVIIPIAMRHVTESRNEGVHGDLDWPGALLVTLGLGGIVYGLIESSNAGWKNWGIIASILLGILALSGFIAVEMNRAAPMMPHATVSFERVHRWQSAYFAPLRSARWKPLFCSAEPHPGAGLLHDCRRGRATTADSVAVHALTLVGWAS